MSDDAENSSTSSFAAVASSAPVVTQEQLSAALKVALPREKDKQKNGKKDRVPLRSAESRIMSNHSKNRNVIIGKKPSSGLMSWGGAPLTVDCYMGRVDRSVTADQIKGDIQTLGVDVVEIEPNKTRHQLFNSFKLVVRKTDFDKLNVPEVWPEGVVFRRFRRPRPPITGHDDHNPNAS